ncbi:MAG: hypothetical protein IKQ97_05735 [Eubacterium sp.]|nr:hypothetical protein [Eubacterium sp.]
MGIFFKKIYSKVWAVALVFALAFGMIGPVSQAAKRVKLTGSKTISVTVDETKIVKVKGVKSKQVKSLKVIIKNKKIASARKKTNLSFKVTGKKKGSTRITVKLKLKKKVNGKKTYTFKKRVRVKKKVSPSPTPTSTPVATPTVEPTPTPVVSGVSISIEKPRYRCALGGEFIGVIAILSPDTANEPVNWVIENPDIADIVQTEPTVNGQSIAIIGGLDLGTTKITATIGAGSASADITVGEDELAAELKGVKQTKSNEIIATLDMDYMFDTQGLDKDKFDIDVYDAQGMVRKTIPVNKIHYEVFYEPLEDGSTATGTSATLSLDSSFSDKDKVVVNLYKGKDFASSREFIASVGAPTSIRVVTTEAQKDVETPIEVALFDANSIDVTPVVDLDSRVTMNITGSEATWNTSPTSTANIKMKKVGTTAKVEVAYTGKENLTTKLDVTGTGIISCIPTKPVVGEPHFMAMLDVKTWPGSDESVAKFYNGIDAEDVELEADTNEKYSFYASSLEDNEAISYDEYSVKSSNDFIATATVEGAGKFCNITITGVKQGECYINVKAKKNTVTTDYYIPVKIYETGAMSVFRIEPSRKTVSNCYDEVYQVENRITATVEDAKGHDLAAGTQAGELDITYEIVSPKDPEPFSFKHSDGGTVILGDRFEVKKPEKGAPTATSFLSSGAKAGSYTVKATANYKGVTKTATCTINVKALPKEVYELDSDNPPNATYSIETESDEVSLSAGLGAVSKVRLKATIGGVFAGYVYMGEYDEGTYPKLTNEEIEAGKSYIGSQSWRTDFNSKYIGCIGDEVKYTVGTEGRFATGSGHPYTYLPDRENAVAKHYQVKGSSVILDFRGAVQSGAKWQTKQPGFADENNNDQQAEDQEGGETAPSTDHYVFLNNRAANFTATKFDKGVVITQDDAEKGLILSAYDSTEEEKNKPQEFYPDKKRDLLYALPGTYGVTFKWKQPRDEKSVAERNLVKKTLSVNVMVTDDIYVPEIEVTKRTLTDYTDSGILNALKLSCDLNSNVSRHASVLGLYDKDFNSISFNNDFVTVSYVLLSEDGLEIYAPLNVTFSKKAEHWH